MTFNDLLDRLNEQPAEALRHTIMVVDSENGVLVIDGVEVAAGRVVITTHPIDFVGNFRNQGVL